MKKILMIVFAVLLAVSLIGVAIAAENGMGAGGPFTSPLIVKDDSLSPVIGTGLGHTRTNGRGQREPCEDASCCFKRSVRISADCQR